MADDSPPARCFRCGGPADEINEIEEGVNCSACAERLLESLPGIFHAPWSLATGEEVAFEVDSGLEEPSDAAPAHAPREAEAPRRPAQPPPPRGPGNGRPA